MSGICRNCGGPEGIHHYATMQCPLNGREAPIGEETIYVGTTYQPDIVDEMSQLREVVLKLADRIAELEESVASMQSASELAESVSIWGAE